MKSTTVFVMLVVGLLLWSNSTIAASIPKGTDFSEITDKQIKWVENKLNNRPRKRLGYLTPNKKVKQIINKDSVAFAG